MRRTECEGVRAMRLSGWVMLIAVAAWVTGCDDGDETPVAEGDGAGDMRAGDMQSADRGLDGALPDAAADAAADAAPDLATPDLAPADLAPVDLAGPDLATPDLDPPDLDPPDLDLPDLAPPDLGPDLGPVEEGVCTPCDDDAQCQQRIGLEARCAELLGTRSCLHGCAANDDCAAGFFCIEGRCTPGGARCDSCVINGCPAGQRCNTLIGTCEDRTGRCGNCREDVDCADGLTCRQVGFVRNCLEPCAGGACPANFTCTDGSCAPTSGICDTCGGGCAGERPLCNFITGQCVQCAPGNPCPAGAICDDAGTCVAPPPGVECNTSLDCRDPARPYCAERQCLGCRNDADCDPGEACDPAGRCAAGDPCERVDCQAGAACAAGVCVDPAGDPACAADADCPGDGRRCNAATGQCYRNDQQCDPAGDIAVCHPGASCVQNPINANEHVCTCARRDPNNFGEPNEDHRIPCQPGGTCLQLGDQPGICARFGG